MAIEWSKAPQSVITIAEQLIEKHHQRLEGFRIAFVFRSEPGMSKGNKVYGRVSKVNDQTKVYFSYDFLIWISEPDWTNFGDHQRQALVDHLLCFCGQNPETGGATLNGPDIIEFSSVLERWGIWRKELRRLEGMNQLRLEMPGTEGIVDAPDPERVKEMEKHMEPEAKPAGA